MKENEKVLNEYFEFDKELPNKADCERYEKEHGLESESMDAIDDATLFMQKVVQNEQPNYAMFRYFVDGVLEEMAERYADSYVSILNKYHDIDEELEDHLHTRYIAQHMWEQIARDLYCHVRAQDKITQRVAISLIAEIDSLRARLGLPPWKPEHKPNLRVVK